MPLQPKTTQQFQKFRTNFSKTLKALCETKGSINRVCLELGINRQQFAKYLSGSTLPSIYVVQRIADYFEVDASIFFIPRGNQNAPAAIVVPKTPTVTPGFYLEYSGVTSGSREAMRISAWKFYRSGTHILCHGEVPAATRRLEFVSYRGEIQNLGPALALSAIADKSKNAHIWAVLSPFEAGPTDYKAISLHGGSVGKSEAISSASLFRYAGESPDLVELVSNRCGTFPKEKFNPKLSQIWALLVQQCTVYDATVALTF